MKDGKITLRSDTCMVIQRRTEPLNYTENMDNQSSSNSSNKENCHIEDGFLSVFLPVMYSIICITGLFSNTLALWVFFYSQQRKTSISVYMRNLAIADLLLVLCLPFRVLYQNNEGPLLLCKIVGAFFYLNMYASILFLSFISLDRYLKITKPLQQFKIHSVPWSSAATGAVWLSTFFCMLPFCFEKRNETPCDKKCFHFRKKGLTGGIINLTAVTMFYILSLLFLFFYSKIAVKLYKVFRNNAHQQIKKKNPKAILKTFVVLAVFILCFVPYHIVRVPYVFSQMGIIKGTKSQQYLHIMNELVLCLSAFNSCLDPMIYFFLSNTFRRTVVYAIKGKFQKIFPKNNLTMNSNRSVTEL
ncbi:probable G-protein coupled receptor 34 [Latimeria chalumnae]|uniref:probable G-protein coupled receptor 34 n=1 Tax=Latimeria chalumnae TaxID=7897 RepID=UPI0003C19C0D|nr:PREDICTED: probable G-protein coupled receptor 34 [Latimeria chalumnae]|eukprot:XP_005994815.1 PREDICTED: probable G-protein coupled receptor 34 [Latimeria chalumnae]